MRAEYIHVLRLCDVMKSSDESYESFVLLFGSFKVCALSKVFREFAIFRRLRLPCA